MNALKRHLNNRPEHLLVPLAAIALAALCVLMSGCSPLTASTRSEQVKQQQASTGASDAAVNIVTKAVEQPKPTPAVGTLSVSGENNKVEITPPPPAPSPEPDRRETRVSGSTGQSGSTSDRFDHRGEDSTSLTIIGYAVGLGLLSLVVFGVGGFVRRSSAAVDAAYRTADDVFARQIQRWRTKAATSTDPLEMAKANAEIAELERDRGIVNAE